MTRLTLLAICSLLLFPACGGPTETDPGGDAIGSDGSGGDDTADAGVATWQERAAAIPATQRERGAAEVCPDAFLDGGFEAGQHDGYEAAGQTRSFYLALPDAEAFPGPRPVLLALNGTGGTGNEAFDKYSGAGFIAGGYIVLAPDSHANGVVWPSWYSMVPPGEPDDNNPDLLYFDSLLDCASAHLEIDENRLYVAGHSAGGIMTNYVLQHRPDVFAGGVPASSIFDLTAPVPAVSMEPMAVVVMWGGDNDIWSGDSEQEGLSVPEIDFRDQAAIASAFYEGLEGGHQIYCKGADLGHSWVHGAGDLVRDFLTAHPKGLGHNPDWSLAEGPAVTDGACFEEAYEYDQSIVVECAASDTDGCQAMCQLFGDCVVSNSTVAPILGPTLESIGFEGADCGGCLATCEATVGDDGDPVMDCVMAAAETAECGDGIPGALPATTAVNTCCVGQAESALCATLCEAILLVSVATAFVEEGCATWIPETPCSSADDCAEDEFCAFDDGMCGWNGGEGTCQTRPETCVGGGPGACGCSTGSAGTNDCEVQAGGADHSGLGGCVLDGGDTRLCGATTCDTMMEYCQVDLSAETDPGAGSCGVAACIDPGPPTCDCVPEAEKANCHDDTGYPMVVIPEG